VLLLLLLHLDTIKGFYLPTDAQLTCLKSNGALFAIGLSLIPISAPYVL
jgi:hypothetical protein